MEAMMEAVMEEVAPVVECESWPVRESSMRKMRAREAAAAEMHASAHATEMRGSEVRASVHAAEVHPSAMHAAEMRASAHAAEMSSHAATMHAASHAAAMAATATMPAAATTAAGERWWRKSKRHAKRTRDQAIKELACCSFPIPPWLNSSDGYRRKRKTTRRPKGSNDFKWQMRQILTGKLVSAWAIGSPTDNS
jgi:hypothetical protein